MLSKEGLGNYLRFIRKEKNISLRDVYKLTGITYSHLSMIENGKRNVTPALLKNLADLYNVDYIDLYKKAGYIDLIKEEKNTSTKILIYGTIPAGIPVEGIEDIIDTEEIPVEMLKGNKQFFGLKIKGNSMEPDYLDNDIIILEKVDDCQNGDDCVVMVNGYDGTFKRVLKNKDGITLKPLNIMYSPMFYNNEQIINLPIKIIGRVVELRRKK